jgi:hypothetical protein
MGEREQIERLEKQLSRAHEDEAIERERAERAEAALRTFRDSYDIWRGGSDEAHIDLAYDEACAALGEARDELREIEARGGPLARSGYAARLRREARDEL